MKAFAFLLVLGLIARSHATVLIYEGPVRTTTTASGEKATSTRRTFFVFDLMTAQAKRVEYFRAGRNKVFRITGAENFRSHLVTGPNDATFKDIIAAETNQPTITELVSHTFFLKGKATPRTHRTDTTRPLPRVFTGGQKDVREENGVNRLVEQVFTLTYQSALTIASNDNGAGLDPSVSRVTDFLVSKGYQPEPP